MWNLWDSQERGHVGEHLDSWIQVNAAGRVARAVCALFELPG